MAESLVLKCVKIIDTVSGETGQPEDVLIIGEHIEQISPDIDTVSNDVKEIDCSGKFIIPGFFDCHTHLAALTKQPPEVQREIFEECELDEPFQEDKLDDLVLFDFLRRGVTQVRDLGGPIDILKSMKEKVSRRDVDGPDIFYAGPMLEMPPLRGASMNERWPGWAVAVESLDDVRDIVTSLEKGGASCVKLFGRLEKEIVKSFIHHTKRASLPVTCDPGPTFFHDISVEKGISLGVGCFEHAKSLWYSVLKDDLKKEHDDLISASFEIQNTFVQKLLNMGEESILVSKLNRLASLISRYNIALCPTLSITELYSKKPEIFNSENPEKYGPVFKVLFDVGCFIVKELAGHNDIRLLVGQDSYIPRLTFNEMNLMSQCGVKPVEILRGATCYPAEWLGEDDEYGSVAVGKKASLVMLDKNPLDDIKNIQLVFAVLKDGEIVFGTV